MRNTMINESILGNIGIVFYTEIYNSRSSF